MEFNKIKNINCGILSKYYNTKIALAAMNTFDIKLKHNLK